MEQAHRVPYLTHAAAKAHRWPPNAVATRPPHTQGAVQTSAGQTSGSQRDSAGTQAALVITSSCSNQTTLNVVNFNGCDIG